jgi:hypothetical protein
MLFNISKQGKRSFSLALKHKMEEVIVKRQHELKEFNKEFG